MRRRQSAAGLVMVELALAIPLLLLLLLAGADLGRAIQSQITLSKAVRDGVRYLAAEAIPDSSGVIALDDTLRQRVVGLVVYGDPAGGGEPLLTGLRGDQVSLSLVGSGDLQITLRYPYPPLFPGWLFGIEGQSTILTATARMRAL